MNISRVNYKIMKLHFTDYVTNICHGGGLEENETKLNKIYYIGTTCIGWS